MKIYGHSDDVVAYELNSGFEDEFGCFDNVCAFHIGTNESGVHVTMSYEGVWVGSVRRVDEDISIPWPISIAASGDGYSVHVLIDCPDETKITRIDPETKEPIDG